MELKKSLIKASDLDELGQYLLGRANSCGIDQAEVELTHARGLSVSARLGKLESLEQHHDQSLMITLYQRQCVASVSSTDWSRSALDQAFDKARSLVRFVQPDPASGLADVSELAFDYPDLDLYHPCEESSGELQKTVIVMDQMACAADSRILHSDSCSYVTSNVHYYYANTHSFSGQYNYTRHQLNCSVVAQDESGKQNYSDFDIHCEAGRLKEPVEFAKDVAIKACQRLQGRKIKTQKCPVLFTPPVAKTLISHFFAAINGHRIYRDSSFLKNRCGKIIFPEHLSFIQRPHKVRSLFSAPFDNEGVRTRELMLVDHGRFDRYICDSYAARKLNCAVTGNAGGVFNVNIESEAKLLGFSEMLKQMHRGFVVTDLMGQGANLVNGDYSKGASGFWVDNGEIQFPVEGVTIAGNLSEMFAGISLLGDDIDTRTSLKLGSVLLDSLTVSGS